MKAVPRLGGKTRVFPAVQQRGAEVSTALLVEYYEELPEPQGDNIKAWEGRIRVALEKFKRKVAGRYNEGTLHRLLDSADTRTRRAAILALGLMGTMNNSNEIIARMLHDDDRGVRQLAADALWTMWFRADTQSNNAELQRLVDMRDRRRKREALDALIAKSPKFAEAYNQRAILHFQNREWLKAVTDCERVLKLNPYHFGAAAGMARCYMELGKHRAALKAFRNAQRINPGMEGIEDKIRALETALGEEGKADDKK
jgi:tetratricopeptide (TPR) repeat protein